MGCIARSTRSHGSWSALLGLLAAAATLTSACGGRGDGSPPAVPAPADAVVSLVGRVGAETVRGTGIVVDAQRRLVLTTAHRVWGAAALQVRTPTGSSSARLAAVSPCSDLAVLQLPEGAGRLTQARLGTARGLRVGERLTGLGFRWPGDATTGQRLDSETAAISAVGEPAPAAEFLPALDDAIAVRTPLALQASGGPLIDRAGRVTALLAIDGERSRIALPADRLRERLALLPAQDDQLDTAWADERERCAGSLDRYAVERRTGFLPGR